MKTDSYSDRDDIFDFQGNEALFESTLSRRIMAFVIDFIVVWFFVLVVGAIIGILGVVTLGLAWGLYPLLFPAIVFLYTGVTLGGHSAATIGMRSVGLEARQGNGARPTVLLSVVHVLVFWISVSVLTPFILLVGLFTRRNRLAHDYVSGLFFVNKEALPTALAR